MTRRSVVVFAPAAIPVGQEIEVHLMNVAGSKAVAVRDLTTGILYGGGGIFEGAPKELVVDGHRPDFRTGTLARFAVVESTYRARVLSCVIANVPQQEGHAPCTSFVVEVAAAQPGPYRT